MSCWLDMYEDFEDVHVQEYNFKVLVVGEVSVGRYASRAFAVLF